MKKTLAILAIIILAVPTFSQTCEKTTTGKYAAAGISVSQGDPRAANEFDTNSFFWGEFGVTRGNVAVGLNFGRSNFRFDSDNDRLVNLYLEPKISATLVEKGFAKGYVLFGAGFYPARLSYSAEELTVDDAQMSQYFIEYGAGTTFSFSNTDLSVQWSNWDRWNYVSVGIARNF